MENISTLFLQYGLIVLFISVSFQQLGAPIPVMPLFFLAGASSVGDGMFAIEAAIVASAATMMANSLWFVAGRRYGSAVLTLLCRISISPDKCVRQSKTSFAQRGVATLVIAKFVPGLSILTAPLAGALGMSVPTFMIFNLAGTALWVGSGVVLGFIFHGQIELLMQYIAALGGYSVILFLGALGLYIGWRLWRRWQLTSKLETLPRLTPAELAGQMKNGVELLIVDVRSVLYRANNEGKIPGASYVDLATIETSSPIDWPKDVHIVTYCECPNDVSALKAAHHIYSQGLSVSVLSGGFHAWVSKGYLIETPNHQS